MKSSSARVIGIVFLLILNCCAEAPIKSESQSIILQYSIESVRKASIDALVIIGARIEKINDTYIEGFVKDRIAVPMSIRGNRVVIWMESLEPNKTKVYVDTANVGGLFEKSDGHDRIINIIRNILPESCTINI